MGSELAVIDRLNQLEVRLDKVERTLATVIPATVDARQTTEPVTHVDALVQCQKVLEE